MMTSEILQRELEERLNMNKNNKVETKKIKIEQLYSLFSLHKDRMIKIYGEDLDFQEATKEIINKANLNEVSSEIIEFLYELINNVVFDGIEQKRYKEIEELYNKQQEINTITKILKDDVYIDEEERKIYQLNKKLLELDYLGTIEKWELLEEYIQHNKENNYKYIIKEKRENVEKEKMINIFYSNFVDIYIKEFKGIEDYKYEKEIEEIIKESIKGLDIKELKSFMLYNIENNKIDYYELLPKELKEDMDIIKNILKNKEVDIVKNELLYIELLNKTFLKRIIKGKEGIVDKYVMPKLYSEENNKLLYSILNKNVKITEILTKENGFIGKDDNNEECDLINDKNFLKELAKGKVNNLIDKVTTKELTKDKNFWLEIVKINNDEITNKKIYDLLGEDKEYLLKIALENDIIKEYYSNDNFLKALFDCDINSDLRISNKEKIKNNIHKNEKLYVYMEDELKKDKEFILELIKRNQEVGNETYHFSYDIEILKEMINGDPTKYNGRYEKWIELQKDGFYTKEKIYELNLYALKEVSKYVNKFNMKTPYIGIYINEELLKDKEFMLKAIEINENIFNSLEVDEEIRRDEDLIYAALKYGSETYEYIAELKDKEGKEIGKKHEIIEYMLKVDPKGIKYVEKEQQSLNVCKIVMDDLLKGIAKAQKFGEMLGQKYMENQKDIEKIIIKENNKDTNLIYLKNEKNKFIAQKFFEISDRGNIDINLFYERNKDELIKEYILSYKEKRIKKRELEDIYKDEEELIVDELEYNEYYTYQADYVLDTLKDKDIMEVIQGDYFSKKQSKKDKELKVMIDKTKLFIKKNMEDKKRLYKILDKLSSSKDVDTINNVMKLDLNKVYYQGKEHYHEYITNIFKNNNKDKKEEENILLFNILKDNEVYIGIKNLLLIKILLSGEFFSYMSKDGYNIKEFLDINGNEIKDSKEFATILLMDKYLEEEKNYIAKKELEKKKISNIYDINEKIEIKEYCKKDKNNIEEFKKEVDEMEEIGYESFVEKNRKKINNVNETVIELINRVKYLDNSLVEDIKNIEEKSAAKKQNKYNNMDIEEKVSSYIIKPLEKYSKFQEYKIKELENITNIVKEKVNEIGGMIEEEKNNLELKYKEKDNIWLYIEELKKVEENIDYLLEKNKHISNFKEKKIDNNERVNNLKENIFEIEKLEKIKERVVNIMKIVETQACNNQVLIQNQNKQIMNAEDAIMLWIIYEKSLENYLKYKKDNIGIERKDGVLEDVYSSGNEVGKNVKKIIKKINNLIFKKEEKKEEFEMEYRTEVYSNYDKEKLRKINEENVERFKKQLVYGGGGGR
jgi:hypothetical protein